MSADAQPCKVRSTDALGGLRLLYVYVQRSTRHTYISIWLKDDHVHPERENCMLERTKMSASGGLRPLTRGFAPGSHWGHSPRSPTIGSRSRPRHELAPQTFRPNSAYVLVAERSSHQICNMFCSRRIQFIQRGRYIDNKTVTTA